MVRGIISSRGKISRTLNRRQQRRISNGDNYFQPHLHLNSQTPCNIWESNKEVIRHDKDSILKPIYANLFTPSSKKIRIILSQILFDINKMRKYGKLCTSYRKSRHFCQTLYQ
ncbi:casein kinase II subunit alpha'-interacting protein isoform X2 [Dasypus novemcinctus]|uniref:casein kinase II subunit alpha'-interacting protein isoform X2 n=1 Tax=Dasypus novemcinctus TaxID=9361 RepID=UPI0039C94219